jgi:hypothetical protein
MQALFLIGACNAIGGKREPRAHGEGRKRQHDAERIHGRHRRKAARPVSRARPDVVMKLPAARPAFGTWG